MKLRVIFIAAGALAAALFVGGYTTYIAIEHHARTEISQAYREQLIAEKVSEKLKLNQQVSQAVMDQADGKISQQAVDSIMQQADSRATELDNEIDQIKGRSPRQIRERRIADKTRELESWQEDIKNSDGKIPGFDEDLKMKVKKLQEEIQQLKSQKP